MAELTAIGPEPNQRWRNSLSEGQVVRLGRAPRDGGWVVPWDMFVSRDHADLSWQADGLHIKCLKTARRGVVFQGQTSREATVPSGETFRIGNTRFVVWETSDATGAGQVLEEHSFAPSELRNFAFGDTDQQMELVSRLPKLIAGSRTDEDFAVQLVELLLEALPRADMAAVIRFQSLSDVEHGEAAMMRWDSRHEDTVRFQPSRRLIQSALAQEKSLIHVWREGETDANSFTVSGNTDWAICTPMQGEACRGWCFYVSGESAFMVSVDDLTGDLRFTELMAQLIGSVRQVRQLEKKRAAMTQFFSPRVLAILDAEQAAELLAPRESDITVIFCDVRGFSRIAERATDDLLRLMDRISQALTIMTHGIIGQDGLIADTQGDAALGFWGWPIAIDDGPLPACRAALNIQSAFKTAAADSRHPLSGFQIGIGVAHGRGVAGKIGTEDQAKVGVLGPIVNLGSRLESLTKQLRVPIIIDEATARIVQKEMRNTEGRCRRLCRIRPYGMEADLMVYELLPPSRVSSITDSHLEDYEAALNLILQGDWRRGIEILGGLPETDGAAAFLKAFLAQHENQPPAGWDGVIPLTSK